MCELQMAMPIYRVAFSNGRLSISSRSVLATDNPIIHIHLFNSIQLISVIYSQLLFCLPASLNCPQQYFFVQIFFPKRFDILLQYLVEGMSRKIKHDQYQLIVCFKTDNCLSISAEFLPTNEHFVNNSVELTRINKDTVLASLEKKSEKNLRCQFEQVFEDGKKQLRIVFIVNFDFLPEFREQISLEFVQLKESIKHLNLTTMQAQIQEMSRALDCMEANGSTVHTELATNYANSEKKEVWSKQVKQGKYILRISGTVNNSNVGGSDKLYFTIQMPGQAEQKQLSFRNHSQPSYHYPFFMSELLTCEEGKIVVKMHSSIQNANVMNLHFVLNRVVEVN